MQTNGHEALLRPKWSQQLVCSHPYLTRGLHQWLQDAGSTTKKIQRVCCGQALDIKLVREAWKDATIEEALVQSQDSVWIREVVESIQGQPLIWARSHFPAAMMRQPHGRMLQALNTMPLGKLIFQDASLQRSKFYYTYLSKEHALYRHISQLVAVSVPGIWGRRSTLTWHQEPFLLEEFFLPHPIWEQDA